MRLIRSCLLEGNYAPTVATIGAYDGLHLGHQHVLANLKKTAKAFDMLTTLISFEPLPKEYFLKDNAPPRLTLLRDKCQLLDQLGIDQFVCIHFNAQFSQLEAEDFVKKMLLDAINVRHLVVGDDFRFGRKRRGDINLLQSMSKNHQFSVEQTGSYSIDGQRVSSSRVRQSLEQADFKQAKALLGRDYAISGRVKHGQKLGRQLGYPTINLTLNHPMAINGVYVVGVCVDNAYYHGVASLGFRPTVNGKKRLLEVYIFNFNQQIYGKHVRVTFLHFIRGEQTFANVETLVEHMQLDEQKARQWLAENSNRN